MDYYSIIIIIIIIIFIIIFKIDHIYLIKHTRNKNE